MNKEVLKQVPVTWRNAAIRVGEDLCSVGPFGYYDMTAEQWLDWALSVVTVHAPPQVVYYTSPQRKPLTDEQISAIEQGIWNPEFFDEVEIQANREFARAIEAAHGIEEKNK